MQMNVDKLISTHILTRRMTIYIFLCSDVINISTHILTRRMTCTINATKGWYRHFNSHPHEEDDGISFKEFRISKISTHILTRRMTTKIYIHLMLDIFQLTSSRGGWRITYYDCSSFISISTHILTRRMTLSTPILRKIFQFQLTSSRGGWLASRVLH